VCCMHTRVFDHMSGPRCSSLTRAAGWHLTDRWWGCTGEPQVPDQRWQRQWSARWSPSRAAQSHGQRTPKPCDGGLPCSAAFCTHRSTLSEVARLNAELKATLAVRAAGVSRWGSELPPLFLQLVLERLQWDPAACAAIRAVCSTWCSILAALRPHLYPFGSATVMKGKLVWYQSVTEVDLAYCANVDVSGVLAELESMSLRSLKLPASCAGRAVDAEAVCGLTTLTTLRFEDVLEYDEDGEPVEEVGEWVLDMSRLPTLNVPQPERMHRRQERGAGRSDKVVTECAVSRLTALTTLNLVTNLNLVFFAQ
jgi:hypothetical protein